jgi:hypothetical protein
MSKDIAKIKTELDREPTPGEVMAHVVRLERVVEKLAGSNLDDLHEAAQPKLPAASRPGRSRSKEPAA